MSKINNKPLKIINNNSNFFNKNSHSNTALKLINNYADSYSKLELENKSLLNQIKDLKINLKISKEIIDSFLSNKSTKINDIIISLNKEINHLNKIIENLNKEKEEFEKNKLILNSSILILKNENLLKKNKIFDLEQKIIKKENLLKIYEKKFNNNFIVISPNKANIKLNNELIFYKNLYKKISRLLKKNVEKMDKYENVINDLEYQNENLENLNKLEKNNIKKEKENLIFKIRKTIIDNNLSINNISNNNNNNNSNISNNKNDKSYRSNNINLNNNNNYHLNLINNNKSEIKNKLEFSDEKINKSLDNIDLFSKFQKDIDINNSEFNDILKQCGINKKSYNLMSKNKNLLKVVEAFEFLNKLIHDKNFTIKILEHENKELFEKNFQLNQENINLINKINNNNSNNNNNITINNLNINNLLNYNNNNKSLEENIMTFESNISSSEFEIKNNKNYGSFVLTSSNTDE